MLKTIEQKIKADQRVIIKELRKALRFGNQVPPRLAQAMRYAVLSPGKRLRPVLTLESFRACGGKTEGWIMPFCCGIELIHTFSLIHDDLPSMDNDDFRRGQPTVHRQFDEATAILAGDALLPLAYELFVSGPAPIARRVSATLLISRAIGIKGMAGGQMLDIEDRRPETGDRRPRTEDRRIAQLKTARLFAASLATGAIVAGASPRLQQRLNSLGMKLGVLFQLTDDLLDIEDRRPETGGRGPEIGDGLCQEAAVLAEKTQKGFLALGPEFAFFAELVPFVLNRRE